MKDLRRSDRLSPRLYRDLIEVALAEDLGSAGDLTSSATVGKGVEAEGSLVLREDGRLCGLDIALEVFRAVDTTVVVEPLTRDGADIEAGRPVARIRGSAHSLLAAERSALNFLGHLSGISTATRELVARIESLGARLTCTRKTTPGLRAVEKYAVRVGGALNHRFGLYDAVLIKDNHIALCGSVEVALRRAKANVGNTVRIEVEVDDLEQLDSALNEGVDVVLLDNMSPMDLRSAVGRCAGRAICEASGGIGPDTVEEVARTGVDLISVGWITHSAPSLDVGFDLGSMPRSGVTADKNLVHSSDTLPSCE